MSVIGPVVSEENMFENVDGRRTDGQRTPESLVLFNFINLTQVHNFTVIAQDIFTFRRLSVFTVSFTGISHVLMR